MILLKVYGGPLQGFDMVRPLVPREQYRALAEAVERALDTMVGPVYASDIHRALKQMGVEIPYEGLLTLLELMAKEKRIKVLG